jgi:hypothetical protein
MKLWSLDARSKGQPDYTLRERVDEKDARKGQGMEPDDLLCSRNARSQKDGKGSLVVLLLAERAR